MFGSKKIAELETQVLTQKHKYEQSETEKLGLEKQIKDLKKAKTDLDQEVLDLTKEKSELEKAKGAWEKEKQDLNDEILELTKEKSELEKQKAALEKEKAGLEKDKAGLEKEKAGLEKDKAGLEKQKAVLEKDKALLESEKSSLEKDKAGLEKEKAVLEKEKAEIAKQFEDRDLEQLRHQAKATLAEYEGLKELYARKNEEFDADREGKEVDFARQAAMDRFNLETEIQQNREANEKYVSATVQTFSETFNYYLNQVRLLTDALGKVASETGRNLFTADLDNLRTNFGLDMVSALKSGTDGLQEGSGNLILIGNSEETAKEEESTGEEASAPESSES